MTPMYGEPVALSNETPALLEMCVDSLESALAAGAGGADRIELCANLVEGGTTPSPGTMAIARELITVPIHVMIRPRGGDFRYSGPELASMIADIAAAREAGMAGVVLGALTTDGRVDREITGMLLEAARPLSVTFHRAFDMTRDPAAALRDLIELGVDRVLTSGQRSRALESLPLLRELTRQAAGRIGIIAAGGIRATNVARIIAGTGVREVHAHVSRRLPSAMTHRVPDVPMGARYEPDEYVLDRTVAEDVYELARELRGSGAERGP